MFTVICGLNSSVLADNQANRITLYTEINHPYVYYKEGTQELTGIAYEIIQGLVKAAALESDIVVKPWLRAVKKQSENSNSCLFIMNRTAQRETKYRWIGPLVRGGLVLFKKQGVDIQINSMADIKGHTVVGKVDGIAVKDLDSKYGAQVILAHSDEAAALMFHQDRAELWAAGAIDGPLAMKYLDLPKPEPAFRMSASDLSMGCSLTLAEEKYQRLLSAFTKLEQQNQAIIDKYLSPKSR